MVVPKSWNRYAYAGDDPINRIDPLGLEYVEPGTLICSNCEVNISGSSGGFSDIGGSFMVDDPGQDPNPGATVPVPPMLPPPPPKMNSIEDIVYYLKGTIEWILSKGKCRDKIGSYLTDPSHQTLFADARDPRVRAVDYTPENMDPDKIGAYFDRTGDAALTVNSWETRTNRRGRTRRVNAQSWVYFGPGFFEEASLQQAVTIIHELLHAVLLANDSERGADSFSTRLGVAHSQIDSWIENGCQ
jgi:hypothetical protein